MTDALVRQITQQPAVGRFPPDLGANAITARMMRSYRIGADALASRLPSKWQTLSKTNLDGSRASSIHYYDFSFDFIVIRQEQQQPPCPELPLRTTEPPQ